MKAIAKQVLKDHATRVVKNKAIEMWKQFEISWKVPKKAKKEDEVPRDSVEVTGVGSQEKQTPLKLSLELLKTLDLKGKNVLLYSNYDTFVAIKLCRRKPVIAKHLGFNEGFFDYKTITFVTDSKELRDAPPVDSWIEPSELVYVENLHDVATIEEELKKHTK